MDLREVFPLIILGLFLIMVVVLAVNEIQLRLGQAHRIRDESRRIGRVTADAEGFDYYRYERLEQRVRWRSVDSVSFVRKEREYNDLLGDFRKLEEEWFITFRNGAGLRLLVIDHVSPLREDWVAAATRYLPGFRADVGLIRDPRREGNQGV
jgi:hypothetical protein